MDRKAIETSYAYDQLRRQHFNGGYFSDTVRAAAEKLKDLSDEDKLQLFTDTFNSVFDTAMLLAESSHFIEDAFDDDDGIDLRAKGLGIIVIDIIDIDEREASSNDLQPFKAIKVRAASFDPVASTRLEYDHNQDDPQGLFTNSQSLVALEVEPESFGQHVFANRDGSFDPGEYEKRDLDIEIVRLLDMKETLDVVCETLGIQPE